MKYIVSWDENRSVVVEADSKEQAEEIIKLGEFNENDVDCSNVDLSTVEATKYK